MSAFGFLPGQDMAQAAEVIAGESAGVRTLPVLPQRGVFGDLMAVTLALLQDLPVDAGPRGWQLSTRPQLRTRRLREALRNDLDVLEAHWGPSDALGLLVCGPWTLAAGVELRNGHRMVADPGAREDLHAMLHEAVAQHIAALQSRFGAQQVHVRVIDPAVHKLCAGSIPGTSDFDPLPRLAPKLMGEHVHGMLGKLREHAASATLDLGRAPLAALAGPAAADALVVYPDVLQWEHAELDFLGHWLGERPITYVADPAVAPRAQATQIVRIFRELGIPAERAQAVRVLDDPKGVSDLVQAGKRIAAARRTEEILAEAAADL